MKLEFVFRLELFREQVPNRQRGGAVMSWIDDDKAASDEGDNRLRLGIELRLHKAKIVAAKLPGIVNALIEHLRSDCARLLAEFPHRLEKQCSLSQGGPPYILSGCKTPWKVLKMQPNIAGAYIDISESRLESRGREISVGSEQIRIEVNDEDELELYFRGIRYLMPDALAAALIRYTRGN